MFTIIRHMGVRLSVYASALFSVRPKRFSSDTVAPESVMLALASSFEKEGKVRTAVDIYKKVIEQYPTSRQAYQMLWNVWADNCSLKVPNKEMNDFIAQYKKYIQYNGNVNTNLKPMLR